MIVVLLLTSLSLKAQLCKTDRDFALTGSGPLLPLHKANFVMKTPDTKQHILLLLPKNSIQELPFFCRMECVVQRKVNFWIKLRTGTDESYRRLLNTTQQ